MAKFEPFRLQSAGLAGEIVRKISSSCLDYGEHISLIEGGKHTNSKAQVFELGAVLSAPGVSGPYNGWVLLAVALLQVFSYPAHDPVMMDRGFLADEATTRASFLHAFWISTLCIIGFGFFGIQASLTGAAYEGELIGTWGQMFFQNLNFPKQHIPSIQNEHILS